MNREKILAILYEMSLVIGNEVKLQPLLNRTIQKLLYHTSFPCGLFFCGKETFQNQTNPDFPVKFHLETAIGDHMIAEQIGQSLELPPLLITGKTELITNKDLFQMLPTDIKYKAALRLVVPQTGIILLLSRTMPPDDLPLTEIFEPVMSMLTKAVLLCQRNELFIKEQAIKQSEENYKQLVQKIRAGIVVHNSDGKITICNSTAQKLLGLSEDQILGKTSIDPDWHFLREDTSIMPVDEYPANLVMSTKKPLGDYVAGIHHPGGSDTIWLLINGDPVFKSENIIRQIIITFVDITLQKSAMAALHQLNSELENRVALRTNELEESNKELEAFAYSVSHDLRAPLRHIDGFVKILIEDSAGKLDESALHYLDVITNSARKMNSLIEDLLSFSRMGRKQIDVQTVDLNQVIAEIIQDMTPDMANRQIQWNISTLPVIEGDSALLRHALYNLIANAVKFTVTREIASIEIGALEKINEHIFFIRDNGVGFDMQLAKNLFGVFQRLHSENDFEGTGIGLANVRRIIQRHKGKVWAEAGVNKGAVFYFSLPK